VVKSELKYIHAMAVKKYNLEEARALWRQVPDDNAVFKAEVEDIEEYPPEIQVVIKEEAGRRRKINETAEENQKRSWLHKITWDGAFGCMFFFVASIMGAPFLIRVLMFGVGIFVGSFVKTLVEGRKDAKR
jgi:hypothetical protein